MLGTESFFSNGEFKRLVLLYDTSVFAGAEIILNESNPTLNFVKFLYMSVNLTRAYVDVSRVNSALKFATKFWLLPSCMLHTMTVLKRVLQYYLRLYIFKVQIYEDVTVPELGGKHLKWEGLFSKIN